MKSSPAMYPISLLMILVGFASVGYTTYYYMSYIVPMNHTFPEPVAKKLRRALHYSNIEVNPKKALAYYKQALEEAQIAGMNQFSDEILGIKITIAAMLENAGQHHLALDIYDALRAQCREWIDAHASSDDAYLADRTRLLKQTIRMSVKIGELYAMPYIHEPELAERNLVEGVELSLRELQRRHDEGTRPGEGEWFNASEIGASLEALADHYESQDQHALSAPLYLRALTLNPPSCHAVVLMNNLASSIAQASPVSSSSSTAPTSRPALIANAKQWAEKALAVAADLKPPERTEECDTGCAVALHNLGEFAEMEGLMEEARAKYEEARGVSKAIGFGRGVEEDGEADEGWMNSREDE
jgi:tetratricopeptide (TPR) repeat protein